MFFGLQLGANMHGLLLQEARETQLTEREREERARRRAREKRLEDFHKANSIQPAINPGLPTSQPHIIDELHKAAQASLLEMQVSNEGLLQSMAIEGCNRAWSV